MPEPWTWTVDEIKSTIELLRKELRRQAAVLEAVLRRLEAVEERKEGPRER